MNNCTTLTSRAADMLHDLDESGLCTNELYSSHWILLQRCDDRSEGYQDYYAFTTFMHGLSYTILMFQHSHLGSIHARITMQFTCRCTAGLGLFHTSKTLPASTTADGVTSTWQ